MKHERSTITEERDAAQEMLREERERANAALQEERQRGEKALGDAQRKVQKLEQRPTLEEANATFHQLQVRSSVRSNV